MKQKFTAPSDAVAHETTMAAVARGEQEMLTSADETYDLRYRRGPPHAPTGKDTE